MDTMQISSAQSTDDPINAAALDQLAALDPSGKVGLVQRVLQTYRRSLQKAMADLEDHLAAANWVEVGRVTHTLRSSSASVGALAVADLCKQAELAARQGRHEALPALCQSLQNESGGVLRRLDDLIRP
jgi:HPt (histidine-containing phosphotransfer) domain-containing protein